MIVSPAVCHDSKKLEGISGDTDEIDSEILWAHQQQVIKIWLLGCFPRGLLKPSNGELEFLLQSFPSFQHVGNDGAQIHAN